MPVTNAHELDVVQIHTTSMGTAVNLAGLEDLQVSPATETRGGATSGTLYSEHESVAAQRPELTFTSLSSIRTALDTVGLLGAPLTDGAHVGLAAYMKKRSKGGSYASGASHRRYRIYDGIIVPTNLRAAFGDDARISYRAVACFDGTHNPIREEDGQTAPTSPSPVRNERFSLYSVELGGVTLNQATNVEIDFGHEIIRSEGATGNLSELVWPTHVSSLRIEPVITISGIDLEWLKSTNIPFQGVAIPHFNSQIALARRKHGTTFYETSAAQHITITTAGLVSVETMVSASDKENGTVTMQVRAVHDGVNVPLVITTGATL